MADKLTTEQDECLKRSWEARLSSRVAAKRAGCSVSATLARFKAWRTESAPEGEPIEGEKRSVSDHADGTRSFDIVTRKPIRTMEDALAFAEINLAVWFVDKCDIRSWEVGMKLKGRDGEPDQANVQTLWGVALKLKRIVAKPIHDGLDLVLKRFTSPSYRLPAPKFKARKPGRTMLEINIPDLHLGKLCWAQETGHDYDLKIAERVYRNALATLLRDGAKYEPDRIVLPIGSDYYHYDTPAGTTTGGTPLDRDGRLAKMFDAGVSLKIWAVAELLKACDQVDLKLVFGNHDGVLALCMARAVAERYHHDKRVTVDYGPSVYKYIRYGVNLIGYTHGDEIKPADLPMIMADQRRQDWAETECQEWHIGHTHTARTLQTKSSDEIRGVEVITVPSLCGTDAWHNKKGFNGNKRASYGFVYDKDEGKRATLRTTARH